MRCLQLCEAIEDAAHDHRSALSAYRSDVLVKIDERSVVATCDVHT